MVYWSRRQPCASYVCIDLLTLVARSLPSRAGAGRPSTPLFLKVLGALRHLGTGEPFTSIEMCLSISDTSLRVFFHRFTEWVDKTFYEQVVGGPNGLGFNSPEEIQREEQLFRSVGLPGFITSMDGVHVAWDRAPSKLRWLFAGKEGYPTLAWWVRVPARDLVCACVLARWAFTVLMIVLRSGLLLLC